MHDERDWGPWIQHCGTKMPDLSRTMEVELANGSRLEVGGGRRHVFLRCAYTGPKYASSWVWSGVGACIPVIRYRYRRSPALRALAEIAENPPPLKEPDHANAA